MDATTLVIAAIPTSVGLIGAIAAVWKIARFIFRFDAALPALLTIAEQFSGHNGQKSLRETLDHLTERSDENEVANKWAVKIAEDSRLVAQTNAKIVEELTGTQTTELLRFKGYIQDSVGEISTKLEIVNAQAAINEKRAASIEERLDKLVPFIKRHREDFEDDEAGLSDD